MLRLLRQLKLRKVMYSCREISYFDSYENKIIRNSNKFTKTIPVFKNFCANFNTSNPEELDNITFEKVCEETLESLTDFFEELVESNEKFKTADVTCSSGVLTINLGQYGTYVINRQSPNKQIWLSSPKSGPKRYDFVKGGCWVYKHDVKTLHELLEKELTNIIGENINMSNCAYYKIE